MQTLHNLAFEARSPLMDAKIEGRLSDPAYDITIYDVNWTAPGEGLFSPKDHCFVELLYYPVEHILGRYPQQHKNNRLKKLGNVLVVPPRASLETSWTTGSQKTLSCLFNLSKLGLVGGFDWRWENIELESTLDIDNPYMEMLLRRLAQETSAPGFASKMQAGCLLTLIALEIRRQFPELGTNEAVSDACLSAAQIDTLSDMIESSTGAGPSLSTLALACDLPPRQLSVSFKNTTGKTLRQFIADSRINKAKALLLDRHLLIKEVAYLSGFQNAAAFTAAFRKAVQLTPQQFREQGGLTYT
ncbi:MAG: AraC family transcriptional regulator [Spongiibacteraceae bacterium]